MTWYKEGLRFKCTGCGKCCSGPSGYVWVTKKEVEEMADFLGITPFEFAQKYLREIDGEYSLIEKKGQGNNYDCIFLKDNKCQVYGARPTQCRTFPWWPDNLESKKAWEECARECEGIDHPDAPLIQLGEIERNLKS